MTINTVTSSDLLHADTALGPVTLKVADLDGMTRYYTDGVGLRMLGQTATAVVLGRPGAPLIRLEHTPLLTHASDTAAGLYHSAILFEHKPDLAAAVYSVAKRYPHSFTGSSDHLVSNAFYFDDPEGNGVELYWDRPRSEWNWNGGRIDIGSRYLDPNTFLRDNLQATEQATSGGSATVGHVHLKVGDIPTARSFYVDTVGFEETTTFGTQALFVSAGGYHHHLGLNTWHSPGAGARTPALGLGQFELELATADDRGALVERLTDRSIPVRDDGRTLSFEDPWNNEIRVSLMNSGV